MSLPFLAKKPINLPPIVSVELIQITDKTNIPFAPKAKKTIEKVKEKEKKLVSEQAPPKKVKKIKPDAVPLPDKKIEKAETNRKIDKVTQNQDKEMDFGGLTLNEEDALKAQIFGCWSIPLGLPLSLIHI